MPTLDELGQKVKAKYPQYKDVPDAELGAKVKAKYPDAYKDFSGTGSTFDKIPVATKAKAHLASMASGPARAQYEQSQASATQDIRNKVSGVVGDVAAAAPFALAAPLTGGMSMLGTTAVMGGLGVLGGAMREAVKDIGGSTEVPKTPQDMAKTLGIDFFTGAIAEPTGYLAGKAAKGLGKIFAEQIPQLVVRSAAKHEMGKALLDQAFDATRAEISNVAPGVHVDVTGSYLKFFDDVSSLPRGKGHLGTRLTQLSDKAQGIFSDVGKDLKIAQGTTSALQPLDALIEMKGRINQIAHDVSTLTGREGPIFQRFAKNLDDDIRAGLKSVGPDAEALFNRANNILKVQKQQDVGLKVVELALKRGAYLSAWGGMAGVVGGRKGGLEGMGKGFLEGAFAGGTMGAVSALGPRMSSHILASQKIGPWVLERLGADPRSRAAFNKAVDFYMKGQTTDAGLQAARAFGIAGIRNDIKEALKQTSAEPEPAMIAP